MERAQSLMSHVSATREDKDRIAEILGDFRFSTGFGKTLSRFVRSGIGVHHAGMLPKYRRLVERLAQAGLLKVICGTDTLGVGINVPIRTVLFTALSKYDGVKTRHLSAREFHQIAGRAGRAGYDVEGSVVVQAPEHVVDNERSLTKAGDDPKKRRKVVRRKPPEGFVSWGEPTFDRLVAADPEQLTSSFAVSHSMLLNVLDRPGDGCAALKQLLTDNHEPRAAQRKHIRRAMAIYRSLLAANVVERLDQPDHEGRLVRVTVDLQSDFALNQPLAPFALAAIDLLDREADTYALDVVSTIEAILEDPRQIIASQVRKAKGELIAELKSRGVEYEERMTLLADVTHPRPLAEPLEAAYGIYRQTQPWVEDHPLLPKSVVRDMWERAMTFADYVQHYDLARSEGILLRYLSSAFKALNQTVPEEAKTDDLYDITEWLGELVRQVDSSLLDEWEALAHPDVVPVLPALDTAPPPVTANVRAFRILVRNELFRRVELAAMRRVDALGELDEATGWTRDRWSARLDEYFGEHPSIGTDVSTESQGPSTAVDQLAMPGAAAAVLVVTTLLWFGGRPTGAGALLTGLGQLAGFGCSVFALVTVLLMARIPGVDQRLGTDRALVWHRRAATLTVTLLVVHMVGTVLGYSAADGSGLGRGVSKLVGHYPDMLTATVGSALLLGVAVTSIRAIRKWLRYETWLFAHWYIYPALFLAFGHELSDGSSFVHASAATLLWTWAHVAVLLTLLWYRVALPAWRANAHPLQVTTVHHEGNDAVTVLLRGVRLDRLRASAGQHLRLRFLVPGGWWQSHPYSLSAPPTDHAFRVTIVDEGDFSQQLMGVRRHPSAGDRSARQPHGGPPPH